jgi:hypothetical protein
MGSERLVRPKHPDKHVTPAKQAPAPVTKCVFVDPMVASAKPKISFPATPVATAWTEKLTIVNDDARDMVVDEIAPATRDVFQSFQVGAPATLKIGAGEQRDVAIVFSPWRAGIAAQTFQIVTADGPTGPGGDFEVEGVGTEQAESTATRLERQDRETTTLDKSHVPDKLHAERVTARATIEKWAREAEQVNQYAADWTADNWIEFIHLTGGEFEAFPSTGPVMRILKKALGDWIDLTFEFEHAASKLFSKHITDSLVDFFFDKIGSESPPSREATAEKAIRSVGRETLAKTREIHELRDRGHLAIDDTRSSLRLKIERATTEEQLRGLTGVVTSDESKPKPRLDDRSLRDGLLSEWVMQRAATPTTANRFTNPDAWKHAKERTADQELLERQDLFVHQCIYEWDRLGLAGVEQQAAILEARRMALDEQFRGWGNDPEASSRYVAAQLGALEQQSLTFTKSADPERTSREFARAFSGTDVAMGGHEEFGNGFRLYCNVSLGVEGTAVYVKRWRYFSTGAGHTHDVFRYPDREH